MVPFSGEITKEVSREIQECEVVNRQNNISLFAFFFFPIYSMSLVKVKEQNPIFELDFFLRHSRVGFHPYNHPLSPNQA